MMQLIDNQYFIYALVAIGLIVNLVKIPDVVLNNIKKILGALWLTAAPVITYAFITEGVKRMSEPNVNMQVVIQWVIIILIFIPIMIGLFIHGWYGVKGEYSTKNG
jgi:hypothetical protein